MSKLRIRSALMVSAVLALSSTWAHAGPCKAAIAEFKAAIRQSAGNPMAGLMAPQSTAAQLDRQPTVRSQFAATMARAKRLDAAGDLEGCTEALNAAKRMYIL